MNVVVAILVILLLVAPASATDIAASIAKKYRGSVATPQQVEAYMARAPTFSPRRRPLIPHITRSPGYGCSALQLRQLVSAVTQKTAAREYFLRPGYCVR